MIGGNYEEDFIIGNDRFDGVGQRRVTARGRKLRISR